MRRARHLFLSALAAALAACGSDTGDEYELGLIPPPAGKDDRLREIQDPGSPKRAHHLQDVDVSGVEVIAVDTFDETGDGRSRGAIYVQDLGAQFPYSGIGLFQPAFIPGNLRVNPGDVLDLSGQYQENAAIGTLAFAAGSVLPQLARPTATFRFELTHRVEPTEINIGDLADFERGRRWLGMLVRVRDVTVYDDVSPSSLFKGRLSVNLLPPDPNARRCEYPFPKPPTLANELADITGAEIPAGTKVTSITGIVTFFCNIHLAPRSLADIER